MAEHSTHTMLGSQAPAAQEAHTATSDGGHGHSAGLPQLNPNDFAPQLIWLALTFGTLYLIMSRIALPRIAGVLEKRRVRINSDIDEAKRLGKTSEDAEKSYKAALAAAKQRAHDIAQQTRDRLSAEVEVKRSEVDQVISAKLLEAELRIDTLKQAAMNEVDAIASSTTREIISHLIGGEISSDEVSRAIATVSGK